MISQYTAVGFLIAKIFIIAALVLYALYAGVMVRQEQVMSKVLAETSEGLLRMLTVVHLIAALVVIVLALLLL